MRTFLALGAFSLIPAFAWAQGGPGTNITLLVGVYRIGMRGDTARVEYVLRNSSASSEDLHRFTVEAPAPVLAISLPEPRENWTTASRAKTLSVARWALLAPLLPPGATSPVLYFDAIGLPTVVTYWAAGRFPVPEYEYVEPAPPLPPRDALAANAVQGKTVGVEPFPADLSPASLLLRLQALTDQTCTAFAWITSAAVCSSLTTKLQQTSQLLAQGDNAGARAQLESFLAELGAQHDTAGTLPVNDNAFWLLKVNAEFILARIPLPTVPMCFGAPATIYVRDGVIVGGPNDGQPYAGSLDGTTGNDVIVGTDARDIVEGSYGADKICGGAGDDLLKGQFDADEIDAGDGNDTVEGGPGNDVILGGAGDDLLKAQEGNDVVDAGAGNDTIEGGGGDDDLDGGPGTDTIKGQAGIDRCRNGETLEGCES